MPLAKFSTEIRKTGFVLENQVAQQLKRAGWTVISNKYYVDDSEESVREIDLLAYRVTKIQHLDVYTVLMVSCKKSESNVWALLAREVNKKDPNSDWWPLHAWSNDKALEFQLSTTGKAEIFHEAARKNGVEQALSFPDVEVFAFQEMDKVSGKPQNDKPIFNAVTSLMKAQAYEIAALPKRKKDTSVYQFNLLSIADTELVRLMFRGEDISAISIDTEHYLSRYIIRKKEIFSRVRFIRASAFETALEDYDRLHQSNCKWFAEQYVDFYHDIVKDSRRIAVLSDQFKSRVAWTIEWRIERNFGRKIEIGTPLISWRGNGKYVSIGLELPDDVLEFLNGNEESLKKISDALQAIYHYEGPSKFEFDIEF